MMQKNNEALMQYVEDIKNLRALILNDLAQPVGQASSAGTSGNSAGAPPKSDAAKEAKSSSQERQAASMSQGIASLSNRENILRKALRYKQLEDDNKKLRKLLKT